jgi:P27 family predicted phage terminase small subunit
MSRAKPVSLKAGNISKEDYENRKNAEENLKGNNLISTEPPLHLCELGKSIYINIIKSLPGELLNNTDEYVVSIVADSIAKMQQSQEIIKRDGLLVEYTNSSGATNTDQNKAILIYNKYCDIFKKYVSEIGLSPSARSKLAILAKDTESEKQDPLIAILNG